MGIQIKDNFFLSQVAEKATKEDLYIGTDLKDTLQAHLHECVGMAGNMIGYNKSVIIFLEDEKMHVMYNPEIIKKVVTIMNVKRDVYLM